MIRYILTVTILHFTVNNLSAEFIYEVSEPIPPETESYITIIGWAGPGILPENLIIPDTLENPEDLDQQIPVRHLANYAFEESSLIGVEIGANVTRIGFAAFRNCQQLEEIGLNEGLENIQAEAFKNCKKLTTLTLPDSLEGLSTEAFYGCTQLTSIAFGNALISLESEVFYGCTSLTSVTFPTDCQMQSIGVNCFHNCNSLEAINFPLSLRYIYENAFYNCRDIEGISFNEGLLEIHQSAFKNCTKLNYLNLPSTLQHLGNQAFYNCSGLTTITDLGMDQVGEPYLGEGIFENCRNITESVTIPDTVQIIPKKMFYNCSSLSNVTVGSSVIEIGIEAFSGSGLSSFTIPSSVTTLGKAAFRNCDSLMALSLPDNITELPEELLYDADAIQTISLPQSLQTIEKSCFALSSIASISIPSTVVAIENNAFKDCEYLTNISFPGNSDLEVLGDYAFRNCDALQSIEIPDGITVFNQGLFYGCENLQTVSLPDSLTEIEGNVFSGCKMLSTLSLPSSVANIGQNAFKDCWRLNDFEFGTPVGDYFADSAITGLGTNVFVNCYSLESIKLPQNLTSIGSNTFKMFPNNSEDFQSMLNTIRLPDSVISIGSYSFSGCSSLANCLLNEGLESIGSASFENCSSLSHFIIPSTVSTILPNAFKGCSGLRYIEFLGDNPGDFSGSLSAFTTSNYNLLPVIFVKTSAEGWLEKWSGRYTKTKAAVSVIALTREDEETPENSIVETYSFDAQETVTLQASPPLGYLFNQWTSESDGFVSGQDPLTYLVGTEHASETLPEVYAFVAKSSQDNSDNDGDLLNNYQEVAIYQTDPNNYDSNSDNVSDGEAVSFWDSVFNYIKDNSIATNHTDIERFTREMLEKTIDVSSNTGIPEIRMGSLSFSQNQNGNFDLTLILQSSEDLINWQDRAESTFEINTTEEKQFYRVLAE